MTIVSKLSNSTRSLNGSVARVTNAKGQPRFIALSKNEKMLVPTLFVRKYAAESIVRQYLNK
jgi:hypothetical protein